MADKEPTERTTAVTEPAHNDDVLVVADSAAYAALFRTDSPITTLERAQELVQYVGSLIGPRRDQYIATLPGGKQYAMHTYWSVYDMALGVTNDQSPVEPFAIPGKPELEAYRCRTTLYMPDGKQLGSGEAICSSDEKPPMRLDVWPHHALFSKTQTRSFVKTHRLAMSLIPLLDGLEPISYDEVVESPITFPGDELDWTKIDDRIQVGLKNLGWGDHKARTRLAKFLNTDGTLDVDKAIAYMSGELAKQDQEAGR